MSIESKFKLITKQEVIDNVPKRWADVYKDGKYRNDHITLELNRLKKPIKEEDVINIVGNDSWTYLRCDVCNGDCHTVVFIEPYSYEQYENPGLTICESCFKGLEKVFNKK